MHMWTDNQQCVYMCMSDDIQLTLNNTGLNCIVPLMSICGFSSINMYSTVSVFVLVIFLTFSLAYLIVRIIVSI